MDEKLYRKLKNIEDAFGSLKNHMFKLNYPDAKLAELNQFKIAWINFSNTLGNTKIADITKYFQANKKPQIVKK